MPAIRVFHNADRVLATEHRRDEIYTDGNRPPAYASAASFTADSDLLSDAQGVIPFESLSVDDPTGRPSLSVDTTERERLRQAVKERTPGAGGEIDTLYAKLKDGSITAEEERRMLILERGL